MHRSGAFAPLFPQRRIVRDMVQIRTVEHHAGRRRRRGHRLLWQVDAVSRRPFARAAAVRELLVRRSTAADFWMPRDSAPQYTARTSAARHHEDYRRETFRCARDRITQGSWSRD
jgi:hypothetical protein